MTENTTSLDNVLEQLRLKAKARYGDKVRMPSIRQIEKLLNAYGITNYVHEKTNVVEYRSKGRAYVNSRHDGKKGLELRIPDARLTLDTSSSYYSYNTWLYAKEIVDLLESVQTANPSFRPLG